MDSCDEVLVVDVPLDVGEETISTDCLSPSEIDRSNRFLRPGMGEQWRRNRAALRRILGQCLGCDPCDVPFRLDCNDKPWIDPAPLNREIEWTFSNSHSGNRAMIAVSNSRLVGVDIECKSRKLDVDAVVTQLFAEDEHSAWQSILPQDRRDAFFDAWTSKEAFLKAIGIGIVGLKQIELPPFPLHRNGFQLKRIGDSICKDFSEETHRMLRQPFDSEWSIHLISISDDFVGSVAIQHPSPRVRFLSWAEWVS